VARPLSPDTLAVVLGRGERRAGEPLTPPLILASTYHAGGDIGYGREGSATWGALEETLGGLEGGRALTFASGMAAANAILETLPLVARIVVSDASFLGVRALLDDRSRLGRLRVALVDVTDTDAVLAACRDTDVLWLESPTNPLLEIADLPALCAGARELGVRVVVDNTFATPLLQTPLDLGADVVFHSVTKFLAGHADLLLGAAVTRDDALHAALLRRRELDGAIPGPFEAFLALRGVRTLPVRLERAEASARELARRLSGHAAVTRVRYPGLPEHPGHERARAQMRGFGAIVSFEVGGGGPAADAVCDRVSVIAHATSLGGVETLIERRAKWPGEQAPEGLLRLSVGCEDVEDLWADLDEALAGAGQPSHTP
jgi:cystathionine gamma-synthase